MPVVEIRTWRWQCDGCGVTVNRHTPNRITPENWKLVAPHGYGGHWIPEQVFCPSCKDTPDGERTGL